MTCELNIHTTTPQKRSTRSIAAKSLATTVAVALGVAMTACSSDATDVAATTTVASPGQTTTTIATTLPPYQSPLGDIVGEALTAGAFTTLAGLLVDAGLVQALRAPGPFTVFAPTDDAFQGEQATAIMPTPRTCAMTRRVRWRCRGQPTPNGRGRGGGNGAT